MAFDPTLPADYSKIVAADLRNQFNALKASPAHRSATWSRSVTCRPFKVLPDGQSFLFVAADVRRLFRFGLAMKLNGLVAGGDKAVGRGIVRDLF